MEVIVDSGSRLHAGFHYIGEGYWGGCGFYLERPGFRIKAWRCRNGSVIGAGESLQVVRGVLGSLHGMCVEVLEEIPLHVGLGSTTQTVLALALAYKALYGTRDPIYVMARRLGRGRYSWVGTLLFAYGGFIADAGAGVNAPEPITRLSIPGEWRFIVVIPQLRRGYSEDIERQILDIARKPSQTSSRLMATGALKLMMGIARRDLKLALEGLKAMQMGTGIYFSKHQGGTYRDDLQRIVEEAERNGIMLAQSSWGPTLYTISTIDQAKGDAYLIKTILSELGIKGEIIVSKPRNQGAKITLISDSS
ncbi:MAG: hypothetical protein GSR85_09340 [Desulfurococcales archaeon]|nr:hypothetical protein [Desulfurococcales archaeon]